MAVLGHSHKAVLAAVLLFVVRSVYMQGKDTGGLVMNYLGQ